VFRPFRGSYDIQAATLGEAVVVHGALILARQQFNNARASTSDSTSDKPG
jgi:hypothetical protein